MTAPQMTRGSHDIQNYATIEAHCDGVPVYAFGRTFVYAVSPDLLPGVALQSGNTRPWHKIVPKKSWEISENKLGSTPAREPKTAANDDQPLLSVHLIDGDPGTVWCSRSQPQPDVEPVWIRIDLPVETIVKSVILVPHSEGLGPDSMRTAASQAAGQAFPTQLTVRLSRDAWHWETVHESDHYAPTSLSTPQELAFEPRPAKQVWIIARGLPQVLTIGHCLSLAGVEVHDEAGANLALISRGAAVTVSSTHTGYGMDRFTQDMLWPIQYDLGYKWTRVGYDMGVFTWAYVEREKGKLSVDSRADAAISEAVENGLNVIMCLDKGNWLHAPHPKSKDRTRELMETYYDHPPEPVVDPAYLEAYVRYVRYMVRHFRDRVRYFEIMNEWNLPVDAAKEYARLAKAAVAAIREEYPEAKIIAVSTSDFDREFIEKYLREGLGPLIDVIAWHPFYQIDPDYTGFVNYARDVRAFKKVCESYGFRGEYMATEWTWSAPYPPASGSAYKPPAEALQAPISEMVKAKYAARLTVTHVGLDMVSLWNETFQTQHTPWSIGLLRNTFSADPVPPTQPEPIYYVQRTLSTVLEGVQPVAMDIQLSNREAAFEVWTFQQPDGASLLAIWSPGKAADLAADTHTDIVLPGADARSVVGIDILNGREQELIASQGGGDAILRDMLIKDFPVLLRWRGRESQ